MTVHLRRRRPSPPRRRLTRATSWRVVAAVVAAAAAATLLLPLAPAAAQPAAGAGNVCLWDFLDPVAGEGSAGGGALTPLEATRTLVHNLEHVCTALRAEDLPTACADGQVLKASSGALVCSAGGGGGSSNSFETHTTPSGTSPVADSATDTLTWAAASPITVTGDSAADSITVACPTCSTGAHTVDTDDQTAAEVLITDAGGLYAATDVEAALQETPPGARTPTAHAASHQDGGGDELSPLTQTIDTCADGDTLEASTATGQWICASPAVGAGITLDLGDDGTDESIDLVEIATVGDANAIVTEPTADKLVIDWGRVAQLGGVAGGQTLIGGTAAGENLTLVSTSHASKGAVVLGDASSSPVLRFVQSPSSPAQLDFQQDGVLRIGANGQFQPQILVIGDQWATAPARQGEIAFRFGPDGDLKFDYTNGVDTNVTVLRMTPDRNLGIGGTTYGGGAGVTHLGNATTAPASNPVDGVILYAADVGASSELHVRDEAGNVTVLSDLTAGGSAEYDPDTPPSTCWGCDEGTGSLTWRWANQGSATDTASLGTLRLNSGDASGSGSTHERNVRWTDLPTATDWAVSAKVTLGTTGINGDSGLILLTGGTEASPTSGFVLVRRVTGGSLSTTKTFFHSVTSYTSGTTGTGGLEVDQPTLGPVWIQLRFVTATNALSAWYSADGITWIQIGTTQTLATDPASVGRVVDMRATTGVAAVTADYFRIRTDAAGLAGEVGE